MGACYLIGPAFAKATAGTTSLSTACYSRGLPHEAAQQRSVVRAKGNKTLDFSKVKTLDFQPFLFRQTSIFSKTLHTLPYTFVIIGIVAAFWSKVKFIFWQQQTLESVVSD